MSISTHVLDAVSGAPAAAMGITLLDAAEYFAAQRTTGFYPEVVIAFHITDAPAKHHVPLLLSPYAHSTYRGS